MAFWDKNSRIHLVIPWLVNDDGYYMVNDDGYFMVNDG